MTTITLFAPVDHGGQTLTRLTIHPPRVGDVLVAEAAERRADKAEDGPSPATAADVALLAACTRLDAATIHGLSLGDFNAAMAILRDFLAAPADGSGKGETSAAPPSPSPARPAPTSAGSSA